MEIEYEYQYEPNGNINHDLIAAIEAVRLDEVKRLLSEGTDVNMLHDAGSNLNSDNNHIPRTPLNTIVFCGSNALLYETARRLLSHYPTTY
jgi:hypothetical protein